MTEANTQWVRVNPLPKAGSATQAVFLRFAQQLFTPLKEKDEIQGIRKSGFHAANACGVDAQSFRVCVSVLCDLKIQGWMFRVEEGQIFIKTPELDQTPISAKARIRSLYQHERDHQLLQPATNDFIRSMETKRLGANGWVSIFSLMRDGRELGLD